MATPETVLPAVEGAGGVILTVFRHASAPGSARFLVEAGNGLGPIEGGLSARQLIPVQHVLNDEETIALVGLHLALYKGLALACLLEIWSLSLSVVPSLICSAFCLLT